MNTKPFLVEETNLSHAWRRVLERAIAEPSREITPLTLTLTGFDEVQEIRQALDADLQRNEETSVDTVSETIFPQSLYELCKQDRHALYREYIANLPRLHKIDTRNRKGTYFERLVAYDKRINQLEGIVSSLRDNQSVRRSKLQASIFDPREDHINGPYQGFPCLQHVTFFVSADGGLVLNSFYAIQLLYRKAYGNWLGLINLGKFVAKEAGLTFERLNCLVSIEQLEITKTEAKKILSNIIAPPSLQEG